MASGAPQAAQHGALLVVGLSRIPAVPKVIDLLREEMARMGREPVRDAELDLAKSYLIGSFPLRLDTSAKVAGFITTVEAEGLGLDYADRYRRTIATVTAADVQRVSARFFAPDTFNRVMVGQIPEVFPRGGRRLPHGAASRAAASCLTIRRSGKLSRWASAARRRRLRSTPTGGSPTPPARWRW
jgi:hypothetical protein